MQIGNPGDPGYDALVKREGAAEIIVSDGLERQLPRALSDPETNVRAGIAYLTVRLAESDLRTVVDPIDGKLYEYVIERGDTFFAIARKVGTTIDTLQRLNPVAATLRPGQRVKYQKAAIKRMITGWRAATLANVALRYNAGDPSYAEKLTYALSVMERVKR